MKLHISALAACALSFALPAAAQTYPAKPVRIIVPYAPGGNTDLTARAVAEKLTDAYKRQFIVDNRPGGATNIGTEAVAKAQPDGYTLLMGGASNAINMTREFIALAKARPGQLNFGSSGIGSSNQMAGELLKMMTGINIVHVPYKGNAPAMTDLLGGHVEMVFAGVPAVAPHMQSGRVRGIAIGSLKRFPAVPDLPTFDESGVKGYEATTWFGMLAPAKTPKDIVARLTTEVDKAVKSADVKERFINEGLEPMGGSGEAFGKFIRAEIDKYAKVIKTTGVPKQ